MWFFDYWLFFTCVPILEFSIKLYESCKMNSIDTHLKAFKQSYLPTESKSVWTRLKQSKNLKNPNNFKHFSV